MIIIAILLTLAILTGKLVYDYNLSKKELPVDHKKEWKLIAIGSIPSVILFSLGAHGFSWNALLSSPFAGLMIAFFIWLMFDGIYNKLRGFGWWFTGTDDPDDASTDIFLQKLKLWQHIAVKVGGFILFTVLFIII
jgi:hypothetical protein